MDKREINKMKLLIARFQEYLDMEQYSPCTIKGYRIHLNHFLRFLAGEPDAAALPDITGEILNRYQMHIHQEKRKDKPLGLYTHHARLIAVRRFFRYLAQKHIILSDPTGGLELPRKPKTLPRHILTVKEVKKILNVPDVDVPLGLRDKAVLELLYSTGIRNAELRHLNLADVDAQNQQIRIEQGKGRKDRVLPLGEIAAHYVNLYIQKARPLLAKGQEPVPALFLNRRGARLGESGLIYTIVAKHVKEAKLTKPVTPHTFRHTCATHMLKGRAGLRHIQALLGHESLETTQRYTHVEISDLQKEHRRCHPREQTK